MDLDPRRSVSQGVFILRDAVLDDTAVFQCEASNKHGSILHNTFGMTDDMLMDGGRTSVARLGQISKCYNI